MNAVKLTTNRAPPNISDQAPSASAQASGYDRRMNIGIVGSNDRAKAIGRLLQAGGHQLSYADLNGPTANSPYRQAIRSELLVMAVQPQELDRAVKALGSGSDTVIVDAVEPERGNGRLSGAEMLARKLDSHRVVRALINMPQSGANIPIAGDDPTAKAAVDRAFRASGCLTTDRGPLSHAIELEAPAAA
jgi:predicted dinucleotide-binding enzyme